MATSGKSKNSKPRAKAINRPFAAEILQRAARLAERYQIVLEHEDGWWYAHGLELAGARGDGATPEAAVADTREALVTMVAYMLEAGERPPAPAQEGRRTEQVNIRLTAEERLHLEGRSQAQGFRGLSDFVRALALLAESPAASSAAPARAGRPRRRMAVKASAGKSAAGR